MLVGCSSDEAASETSLRSVDEIRTAELDAGAIAIGEVGELGDTKVTVSNPVVGGDELGPWLTVDVRAENPSDDVGVWFNFHITCAGSDDEGGWQVGSTFDQNTPLPAGSFDEGTMVLLLPGDARR